MDAMSALRDNRGFHPELEDDHGYLFVDSCVQAFDDADWEMANKHGATTFSVTFSLPWTGVEEALGDAMKWRLVTRQHDTIDLAESADDIRAAHEEGKATLLMAAQDGSFIGDELHRIEAFYELGLRMLIPSYNRMNMICAGCNDQVDPGLTKFGERVVEEANRVGLLLDCSHLGKQSAMDIMDKSDDPVVFSHSNVNEVVDCYRNLDDERILTCAEGGGVIGLTNYGPFVRKEGQTEWPTLDDFIDHLNYVVDLTGSTDHVGIGTDMCLGTYPDWMGTSGWKEPDYLVDEHSDMYNDYMDGGSHSPDRHLKDFNSYPDVVNLIDKLEEHGYSDEDISKILGGNYLRVFDEVWD